MNAACPVARPVALVTTLRAVILGVPLEARELRREARVRDLSARARKAAERSARVSGLEKPRFDLDEEGRPLPGAGVYWSVTHKKKLVAGVVADCRVAIDLEELRPRRSDQIAMVLSKEEHELMGVRAEEAYFTAWAAKEAVLKLSGVGLRDLSKVRVVSFREGAAELSYRDELYRASLHFLGGHVCAVVAGADRTVSFHVGPEALP